MYRILSLKDCYSNVNHVYILKYSASLRIHDMHVHNVWALNGQGRYQR